MKKWVKKKTAWFLCATLVLTGLEGLGDWRGSGQLVNAASVDDMAAGVNIQYHTQDEIRTYIANSGAAVGDALTFAENPVTVQPYSLGRLSEETLNSAVAMVNQIRYIAGISSQVQLSDDYNELAQAASLANYVNNLLSHYPEQPEGMSDAMYDLAAIGASSSNIAWASWADRSLNSTLVSGWMNDGDSSNIDRVGHRRWILNPAMGKTGFGSVSGQNGTYSAVYAFDDSNSNAQEYGVMWPAQNMPVEYFGTSYPWSISMGYAVNESDIQVTLTRESDGKNWIFSREASDGDFYVNNDWYGQSGCIIFRPNTGIDQYNAGESYRVEITGLSKGDVSYTVNFFELVPKATVTETPIPTESPTVSPVLTPTESPEPTASPTPTLSPEPTESPAETPVLSPTPVVSPTAEPTIIPSPTTSSTPEPTEEPETSATPVPTKSPETSATPVPTKSPETSATPVPTKEPEVSATPEPAKAPKVGSKLKDTKNVYIVTRQNKTEKTVTYKQPQNKNVTSISVPKTVKIGGISYKVTAIAANAFKGCNKVTNVTIGSNILSIEKNAFKDCKRLKNITINSTSLTLKKVGKNAFKGISSKAVIKVPAKKYKVYKKLLLERGVVASVKIRKK